MSFEILESGLLEAKEVYALLYPGSVGFYVWYRRTGKPYLYERGVPHAQFAISIKDLERSLKTCPNFKAREAYAKLGLEGLRILAANPNHNFNPKR